MRDLVRGIAESGEWAETHRVEAAQARRRPYFRQDEKLLRYVLTQPPDRVSYRMLTPGDDEMQRIADMALEAGILERRLDVKGLVDRRFIPRRVRSRAHRHAGAVRARARCSRFVPLLLDISERALQRRLGLSVALHSIVSQP